MTNSKKQRLLRGLEQALIGAKPGHNLLAVEEELNTAQKKAYKDALWKGLGSGYITAPSHARASILLKIITN